VLNELKVAVQSQNVQCQTLGLQYFNIVDALRIISEKFDKLFDHFNSTKDSILTKIDELSHISTTNSTSNIVGEPMTDSKLVNRIDRLEENLTNRINIMNDIIKARQDDLYDVYPENEEDFDKINYNQSSSCIQNTFEDQTQLSKLNFPIPQLPFSSTLPFRQFEIFNQASQSNPVPMYSMAPNPNVNITLSDTLPTGPPVSQPSLSVIVPKHHSLSSSIVTSEAQPSYSFKFNSELVNTPQSVITHGAPSIQPFPLGNLPISTSSFSFQPTFKESFEASLNKSRNSATDDSYTEEHDPIPEFQPIIPLPDKMEEITGEENDIILFERRAKLYKYVDKEWKEKGVGVLKILRNNDTDKVRLVMRREQVHKVCANHFLYDNMELKSKGEKGVVWSANDFSDAVKVQVELLCARFKTIEDCNEFSQVFNENKQSCSQSTSLVEDCNTTDDYNETNLESNKDTCLTLSLENEKSLKHELGGFTFSTPPIVNEISTPKQEHKTPEKPKGLFSNFSFSPSIGNTGTSPSFVSLLSKSTDSETKTDSNDKQLFSFNIEKSGLFSTESTPKSTEKSLLSFNKTEDKPLMFTPKLDLTSGTTATSYFSTLAKSSPNIGFTNSPDFKGFPGAGSTIFSVKTNPSPHAIIKSPDKVNNESTSKSNDESEDFIPTAEFTPVISMPEKVDVVTGEEGLEVIFDDRAKLLRFDQNTKEWKEKGVGQMKILHNPKDGYYQLLMRRELVLKVCCNQRLSADLELKPVSSSDKTMFWIGQDFSEGESKKELFALRFKTVQQLHAFRDKFNDVKNKVQEPKKISVETEAVGTQSISEPDTNKTLPKLNELSQFKPKPGSWTCDACYLSNDAKTIKCLACCTLKPGAVDEETTESKSSTGFTFGQSSFSTYKFGSTATNSQSTIPFVMPQFGTSSGVSFGSLNTDSNTNVFGATNKTNQQNNPLTWREESAGLVKYDSDKSDEEGTDETDNESDGYVEQKSIEDEKVQFSFSNCKFLIIITILMI